MTSVQLSISVVYRIHSALFRELFSIPLFEARWSFWVPREKAGVPPVLALQKPENLFFLKNGRVIWPTRQRKVRSARSRLSFLSVQRKWRGGWQFWRALWRLSAWKMETLTSVFPLPGSKALSTSWTSSSSSLFPLEFLQLALLDLLTALFLIFMLHIAAVNQLQIGQQRAKKMPENSKMPENFADTLQALRSGALIPQLDSLASILRSELKVVISMCVGHFGKSPNLFKVLEQSSHFVKWASGHFWNFGNYLRIFYSFGQLIIIFIFYGQFIIIFPIYGHLQFWLLMNRNAVFQFAIKINSHLGLV